MISPPRGVWATSGWNCTAKIGLVGMFHCRRPVSSRWTRWPRTPAAERVHLIAVTHPDLDLLAEGEAPKEPSASRP